MPLTNYTDLATAKLHIGTKHFTTTTYDSLLLDQIEAASRSIDVYCGRYFGQTTETTRRFVAYWGLLIVDDIPSDSDITLIADVHGNEVVSDQYTPFPLNGVVNGVPGYPVTRIKSCSFIRDEMYDVTATYGWSEVPSLIKQSCLMLVADMFFARDTVHGVKGMDEYGVVRIRENMQINAKLKQMTREVVSFR